MNYIIDDGYRADWVKNAFFDGIFEIPIIKKQRDYIPKNLVPFTMRNKTTGKEEILCFYEKDEKFLDLINNPEEYIGDLKKFKGVISVDASLYIDMPLILQITNVYFNRAIGHYLQEKGIFVIPNIRWGDERTYTTKELPEKIAFLGVEKHSIVAIGSFGQIKSKEDKFYFREGLASMLDELNPSIVLVYGNMSPKIFNDFLDKATFVFYEDWISRKKGEKAHGNN